MVLGPFGNFGDRRGFGGGFGGGFGEGFGNQPQYLPTQTLPTQYSQPIVSPTREFVQTNVTNTVVPHVHPSHTTVVNRQIINNEHYFPHTQSVVNECFEQNRMCGKPFNPCKQRRSRRFGF